MAGENFSIGAFCNITKNQDNPIKTVGRDSFLSPSPQGSHSPYILGDTARPRHITCVLVWSKSDQRRLTKTLHKQTDRQTDTKIMITWPWTNKYVLNHNWVPVRPWILLRLRLLKFYFAAKVPELFWKWWKVLEVFTFMLMLKVRFVAWCLVISERELLAALHALRSVFCVVATCCPVRAPGP